MSLMIEAAEAIQHAHTRGILDRDLKPANILIDTQGRPHITDFGLAKLMQTDFELTASGAIMGTPAYMSPEQAAGRREEMSLVTDVYGLGAIFYALLTGKAPFGGDSVIETLDAGHNPQRLQVSSLIGSLPSCMPGSPRASSARNDLASHLAGACRILSPVKEDRMLRVVPDRSYRPIEILNDHAAGPLDKGPHPEVVRPVAHQVVPCFWDVGATIDSQCFRKCKYFEIDDFPHSP